MTEEEQQMWPWKQRRKGAWDGEILAENGNSLQDLEQAKAVFPRV